MIMPNKINTTIGKNNIVINDLKNSFISIYKNVSPIVPFSFKFIAFQV